MLVCFAMVIAAAVPAFAADGDAAPPAADSSPQGSQPATPPATPPAAPPVDEQGDQSEPAGGESSDGSTGEQPSGDSTDGGDAGAGDTGGDTGTDDPDTGSGGETGGSTGQTGATGGTGATEPTGPATDNASDPKTGQDVAPATGDGTPAKPVDTTGPEPTADGTITEDDSDASPKPSSGVNAGGAGGQPILEQLSGDVPIDAGVSGAARDTASRATDQIQRNAESGVAASLVVTKIISEIPSWVFWALAALAVVAAAGLALFARERLRRRSAEQEAMVDQLTGISNRKAFDRRLDLEWRRAARYGRSLGLMVMDLDGFKQVNDMKGHAAGDRVLRDVAQALDARMRDTDLVARIGGDEFAVICPETGVNELMAIRRQLGENVGGALKEKVGLSIGVAEFVPSDEDPTSILARADESMYRVKRGEAVALPA